MSNTATMAVKTTGSLWAIGGAGTYGVLGLNSTINRSSPAQIGTAANWNTVHTGGQHTLAIKSDATLWSWGRANAGRLGLNSTVINRSEPTQIGTDTNWIFAAAGTSSSFAIKNNWTLWAWGLNGGVLGLNDTAPRSSPVQVGANTDWKMVAPGGFASLAIKTDGTLWSWSSTGIGGTMGLNNTLGRSSPTQVGTLTDWKMLAIDVDAGSAAIKSNGTIWTWGSNTAGRLGHGDTLNRSSPAQVGTLTDWHSVSLGGALLARR
jgi:alpha-tubulin suppressor-like RCC1 family protein